MEIDPNEVAASVTTSLLEHAGKGVTTALSSVMKNAAVAMRVGFAEYIADAIERCSKLKTILYPDEKVSIGSLYVPMNFQVNSDIVVERTISASVFSKRKMLISGTAGSGKSLYLKNLTLKMLKEYKGTLPVFLEMRNLKLNDQSHILYDLFENFHHSIPALTYDTFEREVEAGRFALILDGIDEIPYSVRQKYISEINTLCLRFPEMILIISTRPEDQISTLSYMYTCHVQPMNKGQIVSLIGKLEYDQQVKSAFSNAIENGLYERHAEFLNNPLLATLMLLTYSQYSDVPEKIHIFYQQAFEVLFMRHDRSKGAYTRNTYSGLTIDTFQKVLTHFCAASYVDEVYTFSRIDLTERARSAIDDSPEDVPKETKVEDIINDLLETTCILKRDGMSYSFTHRTFQEYFTAWFISKLTPTDASEAIECIFPRADTDIVIPMLRDMNVHLVDEAWTVPTLDQAETIFKAYNIDDDATVFELGKLASAFQVDDGEEVQIVEAPESILSKISFIYIMFDTAPWGVFPKLYATPLREAVKRNPELVLDIQRAAKRYTHHYFSIDEFSILNGSREIVLASAECSTTILYAIGLKAWCHDHLQRISRIRARIDARLASKHGVARRIFSRPLPGVSSQAGPQRVRAVNPLTAYEIRESGKTGEELSKERNPQRREET